MGPGPERSARPTWWRPVLTVAAFSALPFAVFLNDNRAETELDLAIVLYALGVCGLGLVTVVAADRRRGPVGRERAAVVFAVATFLFFHFDIAKELAELLGLSPSPGASTLLVWLVLLGAAVVLAREVSTHPASWTYAALAGSLLLALPVVQYGYFKTTDSAAAGIGSGDPPVEHPTGPAERLPDVYFFLLDGYGRADQLEATVGYDNSQFLRALERRGFEVHDEATAAYSSTYLSLASTLEMGYPAPPGEIGDHAPYYAAIGGDNEAVRSFHELGYRFAFATDYSLFECGPHVDQCVEPREDIVDAALGAREDAILKATPVAALGIEASPLSGYLSPEDVVAEVERGRSDRPVFVYSHILAPHPPYRFLEGCELKTDLGETSVTYWGEADGTGGAEYRQALKCLNRSLIASVKAILAEDDAIIVIQGDHGPKFGFDLSRPLSDWSEDELQQRFAIMNAHRLPPDCARSGTRAAFAANTFRYVLGCITGREPDPLAPRHFTIDSERDQVERVATGRLGKGRR